jgi:hypothetical protein
MNKSESIANLASSLTKAQLELKNPAFDSTNPHFRNKFASLVSVRAAVIPALNKHGLTISQFPKCADGLAGCVNVLLHSSGEFIEDECLLPLSKNDPQGAGSAITYARRYSLQAIAGVVADEDDDANAASTPAAPSKPTLALSVPAQVWESLDVEQQKFLQTVADQARSKAEREGWTAACAWIEEQRLDHDDKVALWSRFDSKERAAMEPNKRPKKAA